MDALMTRPDVTQAEIDAICYPLRQPTAQIRFLRSLGLHVDRRPNGAPLVWRAHLEAVKGAGSMSSAAAAPRTSPADEPNVTGMQAWLATRGKNGTQTRRG